MYRSSFHIAAARGPPERRPYSLETRLRRQTVPATNASTRSNCGQRGGTLQPQRVSVSAGVPRLVGVLRELPVRSAILDDESVASDADGMPDFWRLFVRSAKSVELHFWAFNLLALNRKDLQKWLL